MKLISIYINHPGIGRREAIKFLWDMLLERDPIANISHRRVPSFAEHKAFVEDRPYISWYLIEHADAWIGSIYLTSNYEIGIFLKKEAQGQGLGKWAVQELMKIHGAGRYLANIAPKNIRSQDFFTHLGFKLIQYTYEFDHA